MSSGEEQSWIAWFCSLRTNKFFCEVDEDYIDLNNCEGLRHMRYFSTAYETILDLKEQEECGSYERLEKEFAAERLYGMLHSRYIMTEEGLQKMREKYEKGDFGTCPRALCEWQNTLPVGLSDLLEEDTVKLYCPRCRDIYNPRARYEDVEGAYFGTGFPHMFFMEHPELRPKPKPKPFKAKLFGFKIHKTAYDLQYKVPAKDPKGHQMLIRDLNNPLFNESELNYFKKKASERKALEALKENNNAE